MVDEGCHSLLYGLASSHANRPRRIAGLKLVGAVFTNISHDHLDYHALWWIHQAKEKAIDDLPKDAFAPCQMTTISEVKWCSELLKQHIRSFALKSPADSKERSFPIPLKDFGTRYQWGSVTWFRRSVHSMLQPVSSAWSAVFAGERKMKPSGAIKHPWREGQIWSNWNRRNYRHCDYAQPLDALEICTEDS